MFLAGVGAERQARPGLERLGDVRVELPCLLLLDRAGDVLPMVVERAGDLLGRGEHDERLRGHEVQRRDERPMNGSRLAFGCGAPSHQLVAMLGADLRRRRELDPLGVA